MVIAACRLKLHLPGCASLKEKRSRLKPLIARLHREFNVAVAEVNHHEVWQTAEVALVAVSTDPNHAHAELQTIVRWVEHHHPELEVDEAPIELR